MNADLERQVTERARKRSRTWQLSTDLLAIANVQGFFEHSNPAWQVVLGWSESEIARTPLLDLVHPDDVAATTAALRQFEAGDPVLHLVNRYCRKDGGYRWLSWVAVPEDGSFYCSARDVTDEREKAAALAERTAELDHLWNTSPISFS